jgi:hypothetical protein
MDKPILNKEISLEDFNDFYWLKKELVHFCRTLGISSVGGKIEISDRIRTYLSTGKIVKQVKNTHKTTSKFDWDNEVLTKNTMITDNYKNGANVRSFFIQEIGSHFRFNVIFMKWMKENIGKTLDEAILEWKRIEELKKDRDFVSEINPQFEYNRYMRAFIEDNPNLSSKDAMNFWKLKSARRGTNEYERKDLELI